MIIEERKPKQPGTAREVVEGVFGYNVYFFTKDTRDIRYCYKKTHWREKKDEHRDK